MKMKNGIFLFFQITLPKNSAAMKAKKVQARRTKQIIAAKALKSKKIGAPKKMAAAAVPSKKVVRAAPEKK